MQLRKHLMVQKYVRQTNFMPYLINYTEIDNPGPTKV